MRQARFRIRTLMNVVAVTAVALTLSAVLFWWLDLHVHNFYFSFESPR
jgi:uncharacterized membrane protein AbrB (regulator of aidB expression)